MVLGELFQHSRDTQLTLIETSILIYWHVYDPYQKWFPSWADLGNIWDTDYCQYRF